MKKYILKTEVFGIYEGRESRIGTILLGELIRLNEVIRSASFNFHVYEMYLAVYMQS